MNINITIMVPAQYVREHLLTHKPAERAVKSVAYVPPTVRSTFRHHEQCGTWVVAIGFERQRLLIVAGYVSELEALAHADKLALPFSDAYLLARQMTAKVGAN